MPKSYTFSLILTSIMSIIIVSFLVGFSYYWNIKNIHNEKIKLALSEAQANWSKDASFRKWATLHGGIYVKPNERTPRNPYLANVPNRDIITTDGTHLTLMNPAYMMRQLAEEFEKNFGIKGKITGKVQLNPMNKPDNWQLKALNVFESGETNEFFEQHAINGEPYLRYMKAVYMTEGCVKCHGHLGFKDGDLRGGVSVSIPLTPYFNAAKESNKGILTTHWTVWAISFFAITIIAKLISNLLSQLSKKSLHDGLTKLPNITLFKNRLNQSLAKFHRDSKCQFAVCFLDLNRFKVLNDSRGHDVGDLLLIALSKRLSKLIRPGDTLARMGGDEFTLLLENVKGIDDTLKIIDRILESFHQPFIIKNDEIFTNTSIGICIVTKDYHNADDLIRNADIAMYRAKASGKGHLEFFNPEMHKLAVETMLIENDLQSALSHNQLEVFYQPVVNSDLNIIEGFEALLRWHHPTLGYISPERFIPIAEYTGLIKELGGWVLEKSCRQVNEWNKNFKTEFSIAVNLSAIQLTEPDFDRTVQNIVNKTGLNISNLHLEVTETMLIEQKDHAINAIQKIRNLGVQVSIDDFGTGYCSLTYLQEFDFDTLKIDKEFIQKMEPDSKGLQLVKTLLSLAYDLNLNVIAEGVETKAQMNLLRKMKCYCIQGYYYSRPLSAENINKKLVTKSHLDANLLLNQ